MNRKLSQHPTYDDPTAFSKRFPRIEKADGGTAMSVLMGVQEQRYKMGAIRAVVAPPAAERPFFFMSVHGRDRYPSWDELVWLRYNLIPDAAVMVMVLPNLNAYINQETTDYKYVFTMEQRSWALNPEPRCPNCGGPLTPRDVRPTSATLTCADLTHTPVEIDFCTWNEAHGNGFLARR